MPIGSGIVYNTGDLILSQVSSSGTAFLETKIAAATSSIIYFDSTARINSASLNSLTVGTASYVSGSTSIITNLTASNISVSGTGYFGTITSSGNIQVGPFNVVTTTPSQLIFGNYQDSGTTRPEFVFNGASAWMGLGQLTASSVNHLRLGAITGTNTNWGTFGAIPFNLMIDGGLSVGTTASLNNGLLVSGSIGVGTTNPINKLDVVGNISASVVTASLFFGTSSWAVNAVTASFVSNAFFQNGNSFGTTALLGTNDANSLAFETNGSTRMTINSGGQVGIGVSPVSYYKTYISDTHAASQGSASLYVLTTQNQGTGPTNSNDAGIISYYTVNALTSSASQQNQASYNQIAFAASGSYSGSYRAARNGILLTNTASFDTIASLINTYLTNQIGTLIPNFSIPNFYAGDYVSVAETVPGTSTGNITNLYGYTILTPWSNGTAITTTNSYGAYIYAQKSGTNGVVNGWGIYQAGTSDINIFAGRTRIGGTTTPVNLLDVNGNISASVVTASLFFGTASLANTASSLIPTNNYTITNLTASNISASGAIIATSFTGSLSGSITNALTASYLTPSNSYTITNLTASGVVRAAQIAEKVVTFTPLTGSLTGAPAWYRIISGSGVLDSGRVRMSANYDNSRSDIEFTYAVRNYDTDGAGAFINITRASTYNSLFNAVRVIETGNLAEPYAIDVLIGNYLNNTTPGPVTCLYESQFIGAVLDVPTFVSASATGSNIVKTVYTTYTSGYPRIGPTYSDGLAVATVQGQLSVGYRGNYAYNTPSTNNYALLVSGSVGIGTTTLGEKLTVSGSSYIIGGTGAVGTGVAYYLGDSTNRDLSITRVGTAAMAIGRYYPSAWAETIRFTADGYVGIGTTAPFTTGGTAQLTLVNSSVALSFGASNTDMSYIRRLSSAVYQWQTFNGSNAGEIHLQPYGGNVGIGTTSAVALLDVSSGDYQNAGALRLGADIGASTRTNNTRKYGAITLFPYNNLSASVQAIGIDATNAATTGLTIGGGSVSFASPTQIQFYTTSSTTVPGAERMRIDSSGNVGIGTTIPSTSLHVFSTNSTLATFTRDLATDASFTIGADNNGVVLGTLGVHAIQFYTNATEKVRITSVGNVGIGTNSPAYLLDVSGSSRHGYQASDTHQFTGSVSFTDGLFLTNLTASNVSASNTLSASNVWFGNSMTYVETMATGSVTTPDITFTSTATTGSDVMFRIDTTALTGSAVALQINASGSQASYAISASNGIIAGTNYIATNITASNISASLTGSFGTVGIGTTLPSAKFHISASTGQSPLRIESQDSADTVPQIYVEGNQAVGSPALATNIQLVSNQDYRGRGITFTNRTTSTSWFSGIPYTGASYQIGYDSTTNGRAHYVQSSSLIILSNGNIGIGTSSPGYKLTIQNDVASTNSLLTLQNFSTSSTTNHGVSILPILSDNTGSTAITAGGLYWLKEQQWTNDTTSRDSYLRIDTTENNSASEKVRITSAGNVGIGTTNPTSKLHIVTTGTNDGIILDGSTNPIFIHRTSGSDRTYLATITSAGSFFTDANAYDFVIRSQTSNILLGRGSGASTMAIVGSNVGIGVVSPSGRLHITGSATASETLLYLSKGSGSITQNYINAVDQAGSINYRVTSDINGYAQQTLYRSGTSYVYHDAYWSSWINNANYAQGGLALGTGSLTHGYALNISRPATSGSLYVSGSSVFTGSVSISGSVTFSGPIIYDNAVLLDYGSTSTPVVSTNYVVLQNLTGSYNSAFFDYFASSGSNFRAGTVIAGWSGSSINYTEYATTDVGNTNQLSMSVDLSGSYVRLLTRVSTTINWNIKSAGRYL